MSPGRQCCGWSAACGCGRSPRIGASQAGHRNRFEDGTAKKNEALAIVCIIALLALGGSPLIKAAALGWIVPVEKIRLLDQVDGYFGPGQPGKPNAARD